MDAHRFDNLLRSLATSPTRRGVGRAVVGLALFGPLSVLLNLDDSEAKTKKRKKRKKKCAKAGQASKKKKRCCRGLLKDAAGRCAPPCTPTSCAANSLCVDGVCQPCDVCQPAGACAYDSVQAAINAGDLLPATILICPGIYVGDLDIARSLTLIGAGDGVSDGTDTILEGTGTRSVVVVDAEIEVTLQRLRIEGGKIELDTGGGIRNFGDLTLTDCTISGNSASYGGGIDNIHGTVALTNSTVIGNVAGINGGGIFNLFGTVSLDAASRVVLNAANNPNEPDSGGGILNQQGTVTLSSPDNVSDNTPDQCGGTAVPLCSG